MMAIMVHNHTGCGMDDMFLDAAHPLIIVHGVGDECRPGVLYAFDIMPADLSGSNCRLPICHARSLVSYLAVRELRMSGAAVARRMNLDRSSVSRAIARVSKEPRLMKKVNAVLSVLMPGSKREVL
jgi:hypothetical protein